ncbi:hypothetical protein GCM10028805_43210 [Spirosoma harenae]
MSLSDLLSFVSADTVERVLADVNARYGGIDLQGVIRSFLRHDLRLTQSDGQPSWCTELRDVSAQERTRMYKVYQFVL